MSRDDEIINTIRFLSVDQVERAKSGHPGMPLGAAHIGYIIFDRFLKFNPKNPRWIDRDRFILSAGHASAMLYSLLFINGYDISIEDLKRFRQLDSITPGHPENILTPGVEVTSGPLGQGFGNSVGMAIAERYLSSYFNRDGFKVIDHYTYVLASDGDLMEGVSSEAAALAGHFKLNKLIVIWDNNKVTIDGPTSLAWSENVLERFDALGWYVQDIVDGYNLSKIEDAIRNAREQKDKPSLIAIRTHIAYGSRLQDDSRAHGAPLGREVVEELKKKFNWPLEEFYIPEEVWRYREEKIKNGVKIEEEWRRLFERYREAYPDLADLLLRCFNKDWGNEYKKHLPVFTEGMATRAASGKVLNAIAKHIPMMLAGSADLFESTNTYLHGLGDFQADNPLGRNIHYGVREHAMGAIMNGMAYHGGILPYGGTFLVFSDYMRPAIRLAAMAGLQVIYVFSHDSLWIGEDGPTHQPVEQLSSLRLIPNLWVIRPCDPNEVSVAWEIAIERKDGPTAIILTRQKVPVLDRNKYPPASNIKKGAYILADTDRSPDILVLASGSEVHLALEVKEMLENRGIKTRVVNMASFEIFEQQDEEYKQRVIPKNVRKVAIEAGRGLCWYKYVGENGLVISIERFGKSAPYQDLMRDFGFTSERILYEIMKHFNIS
ncbi:MAG: transketolase [Thaumarchaeota archaeon]|jgi:transketolase|nr:transketolase [Candidatus Geocrenenecus arthurdayi]